MRTILAALAVALTPAAASAAQYAKVAIVAESGGDYTHPVAAMNDLATWCGTPDATHGCLLKIMPGTYDVAAIPPGILVMRSYVDVEGSGANVTTLKSNLGTTYLYAVMFSYTADAELRSLSIDCGDGMRCINSVSASAAVRQVSVRAKAMGIDASGSRNPNRLLLDHVKVSTTGPGAGYAVRSSDGVNLTLLDCELAVSGGRTNVYALSTERNAYYGARTQVFDSTITASGAQCNWGVYSRYDTETSLTNTRVSVAGTYGCTAAVRNLNAMDQAGAARGVVRIEGSQLSGPISVFTDGDARIGSSRLDAAPVVGGWTPVGTIWCAHSYDANFAELGSSCMPLP